MDMQAPVLKQEMLGDQMARILRRAIASGELARGTHLVEGPLSEQFGVSRGPVRDALRTLAADGLVEYRRRGAFVVGLDENDIDEIYSLREVLEGFAVAIVLEQERPDLASANAAVESMRDAAKRSDAASFADADLVFHRALFAAAHHRRLYAMWQLLEPTLTALLEIGTSQDRDLRPSAESHAQIIELIERRDGEAARVELASHLLGSRERITQAHSNYAKSETH